MRQFGRGFTKNGLEVVAHAHTTVVKWYSNQIFLHLKMQIKINKLKQNAFQN